MPSSPEEESASPARTRPWVRALAAAAVLVTAIPALAGRAFCPAGRTYTGMRPINVVDPMGYLSFIEQAREGHVLLRNLYTHEAQPAFQVRLTYLVGGWIARASSLSNDAAESVVRALAVFAFVLALDRFGRRFVSPRASLFFCVLALVAGGVGWLAGPGSADVTMPETVTLQALQEGPHFAVSLVLLLEALGVAAVALGAAPGECRASTHVLGLAATLALAFEHPFDIFALGPVIAAALALALARGARPSRAAWLSLASIALGAALGLGYHAVALRLVPVYAAWARQNVMPSPAPGHLLAAYGLLLPLALIGAWRLARTRAPAARLLALAGFLPLALAYAPVDFQRRVVEGAQLPLALLASVAVVGWLEGEAGARLPRRLAVLLLGIVLGITNARLVENDVATLRRGEAPYTLPDSLLDGLAWIRSSTPEGSVVLAEPAIGNLVPGLTGRTTFVGNLYTTVRYEQKIEAQRRYYEGPGPCPGPIDYVVLGSWREGEGRSPWIPTSSLWKKVWDNGTLAVYEAARSRDK